MTATDDYSGEMPGVRQIDDATAEQLVAGRTMPPTLEPVATVVRALREVSAQPVRPSDALRDQMAAGVFTGTPVYAYQPEPTGWARRVATVLAARIARLRLATKLVAVGAAGLVLSLGTAGFAGTLPAPVQDRFETVVESVTPYQFPSKTANPDRDPGGGGPIEEESVGGTGDQDGGDEQPSPTPASNGNGNGDGGGNGNGNGGGNGNGNGNAGGNGNGGGNGNAGGNGNGNGNGGGNGNGNGNNGNGNGNQE